MVIFLRAAILGPLRLRACLASGWGLKWVGVRRPAEPCCLRKVSSWMGAASALLCCSHCSYFAVWTGLSSADSEALSTAGLYCARWSTDGLLHLFAELEATHYRLRHHSSQLHPQPKAYEVDARVAPNKFKLMNCEADSWLNLFWQKCLNDDVRFLCLSHHLIVDWICKPN